MPYLGNPPAERFTSLSKQTITGDGGTAYTLDFPVGSEQDIEVFVNNVRQEPSVAYTVSGTSLTMTGAVQSSDDFYVVFQGKAIGTISHPAANALQATSGTFTGNVGIGTTSPQDTLHVGGTGDTGIKIGTQGSTGRARIFVDSSNDYALAIDTQNVSDALVIERVAGNVGIGTSSPSRPLHVNNASESNVRIQGGSDIAELRVKDADNAFSFHFNSAERMRIDSSGDIQIGKTDASQNTQGIILNNYGTIRANSQATEALHLVRSTEGNIARFYHNNTTLVGNINVTSSSTAYNTSSDYRLKENVTPLDNASDRLKQIPVHRFNFIADPDTTVDGFLAHEVQAFVPEAITGAKDGMRDEEYEVTPAVLDDDGNVVTEAVMGTRSVPDYQGIDQSKLVPLLTAALQEALTKIEDLEARLSTLETN